jgi:protein TonB
MALATNFAPSEKRNGDFDKIVEFVRLREESALTPQPRTISPPKPPPPPELRTEIDASAIEATSAYAFKIDSSMLSTSGIAMGRGTPERGLIPVSGIAPNYPRAAKTRGIEGNVELEFVITESGEVTDITVISAANGDWFIETAVRALSRWRFSPKIVNGAPTRQLARQVFTFKLEN